MLYSEGDEFNFPFTKNLNEIIVLKIDGTPQRYKFTVVGYDGVELRLKVDYVPTMWGYDYLGGTLVFKK